MTQQRMTEEYSRMISLEAKNPFYLLPFLRLHSLQSIWQFLTSVLPPSRQGVIWSPSMNWQSNSLPQMAHLWFCFSHTASLILSGKARRSRLCSIQQNIKITLHFPKKVYSSLYFHWIKLKSQSTIYQKVKQQKQTKNRFINDKYSIENLSYNNILCFYPSSSISFFTSSKSFATSI